MKAAFVGQLFEGAKCFVDRNTLASRRFEDEAYRSDGRKPDRLACSARGSVVR